MLKRLYSKIPRLLLTLIVGLMASSTAFGTATIVIQNNDGPNVGFNDPTPVTPVGGNSGTTVGQQRLNAFQFAANIWGATLTSGPTITIRASWAPLTCTANSGTLGASSNNSSIWRDFPAAVPGTWYGNALANALRNTDLNGATAEIRAEFNSNLGTTGCLENLHWYYGLDTNTGFGGINLVTVLLHEFAHGLGFQTFTSSSTGRQAGDDMDGRFPSIYDRFLFDNSAAKTWPQMTDAERVASAINTNNLAWNGPQVTSDATVLTSGKDSSGRPLVYTPNPLQGGSSVSHWDTAATPNQLMEPNISNSLSHSVTPPQDLTFSLMRDIGWCSGCPQPPPPSPTPTPSPTPIPSPPANNDFANAQIITGCSGSVNGTNLGANKEPGEPSHSPDDDPGGGSVWYQWQAPSSGSVTMTTAGSTNDDTVLAVYTGNSVSTLTAIVKNDDVDLGNLRTSIVTFNTTSGTVYKIAVDGWDNERGDIVLNWNLACKTDQTITFPALANKVYGDAPFTISSTATSGLPVSFSIVSGPATISGNTITITGVGVVTVGASQAGDANFNAATSVDRTFTVAKANQTITFNAPPNKTLGDPPFNLIATSPAGSVTFQLLSGPAAISGINTLTITGAGIVSIRALDFGNSNYNPAPPVDQSFNVNKANQTITFNALANKSFGDAPFNVSATSSSSLPVSFSIVSGPATISGNTITITGVGVVTIRASQAGDANFNAATSVDRTFTVAKANQTITSNPLSGKTYGDAPFIVSASASSGLPVSFSILSGPVTIAGNTVTITGVGTVTVRASQAGDSNYNAATSVDRTFTVAKSNQTITFSSLSDKTYGDTPFIVSASASSSLPVSFIILSGPASVFGDTVTITGVGTVIVRASQEGNGNYNAAPTVDQSFTVNKANQTITFDALANKTFGDAPFNVSATSSSSLPVSFSILSGAATVFGNTVTITGAGSVTVRASQGGDSNFNAANSIDRVFTVAKANQTITFNSLPSKTFGDSPFALTATASSGLPVSFQIVSGPATLSGNTVTITGTGLVTVRALQGGDTNFNAAPSQDRTFNVASANANLSLSNLAHIYDGTAKLATVTTNPAGLSVTLSYSLNGSPVSSPTNAGEYSVTATINDPNFQGTTTGTLVINKATPVITWNNPSDIVFGTALSNAQFNATANIPGNFLYSPAAGIVLSVGTYQLSTIFIPSDVANYYTAAASVQLTVVPPSWNPTTLTSNQVEIKTWTTGGRTYAYVKLLFPNAGYRVANWGQPVRVGNDFSADAAVEKFTGASVQAVTTTAQIYDLGVVADGNYTFTFKNSSVVVKSQAFTVSSATPPPNPIDNAREFVRWQYRDFLNREADQAGEDFWTDNITKCSDPARRPPDQMGQTEAQCTVRQRETTSGAFFLSPEFQYTGYYVYRMYQGGLGRQPKLSEFTPDAQFVGAGILVNGQLSAAKINQNKADFAQQFVNCTDPAKYRCSEFKANYDGLNNQQYVDKLFETTGVNASASDRAALVNGLNANPATETRASVLQKVVDSIVVISEGNQQFTTSYGQAFYNSEFNRAFVQLEYFGYMKRDPDDAGYAFWLDKLNQFGGNFVNAEMVLAFISSPEYRARFGQP